MSSILIGLVWLGEKIFSEKLLNIVSFSLQVPADSLYQTCVFSFTVLSYYNSLPCNIFLVFLNQEHEKRCWSVDFNLMDPKLLASGSDDAKGTLLFQSLCRRLRLCVFPWKNNNVLFQGADSSAAFSIVVVVVMCQDITEPFGSCRRRGFVWIKISCFTHFFCLCVIYLQLTFFLGSKQTKMCFNIS